MKYLYILLFLLGTTVAHGQIVNIPDSNFKNALIDAGVDTNNDGEIQVSEAEAIINLNVTGKGISSLEGIESFINIEELHCSSNQLTSLDMSMNISLQKLTCIFNQLSVLNVTQNTNLTFLWCQNNQLSVLDISQNTNLDKLDCSFNQLGQIDISHNSNLLQLDCGNNQLSVLDISQNPALEILSFDSNMINNIDVSQNLNLKVFTSGNNTLSQLDLSLQGSLEYLECSENQLTTLFIDNGNNQNLTTFISTGNPDLTCIQVDDENAPRPECQGLPLTGWCKDPWSNYSEDCSIGIAEVKVNEVAIYPNPTSDKLFVEANSQLESVRVFDLLGRKVLETFPQTEKAEVDFNTLKAGIYIAVISSEGKSMVKKIVKE